MNESSRSIYAFISLLLLIGFLIINKSKEPSKNITEDEIMNHIRYLSHENRGGRLPGSRGSKDAIAYLIKNFKSYNVQPAFENSFTQPFNIKTGVFLGDKNNLIINKDTLDVEIDYTPLSFSANGHFLSEAVFVGYGFQILEKELKWDDYNGINVKDKWVIIMRHSPERNNQHSIYSKHSTMHKKMLVARDNGAKGVIFVSQIEDEELYPLQYIPEYKNDIIPALILSNDKADKIFNRVGWSRKQIQKTMNQNLQPLNFQLGNLKIDATITLDPEITRGANIVGKIYSGNRRFRDEYIVIGAHFDHIGFGGDGSGSRKPDEEILHPGADDNASGVAGLLELAQKLSSQKNRLKRSVLLIGFDAEEKGLLGAKHFVKTPPVNLENITTMINMDMIGRMSDSTYTVGGVGTSPGFEPLLDSLKNGRLFVLNMNKPGFGPSDHAAFYSENIPVLFFFSGFHNEYHTPDDTWKLINLKGQKQILDLIYDLVFYLSRAPERTVFQKAGPKAGQMGTPRKFNVTLGIMPSYGSMQIGLEVDGISKKNGPGAKAGIQKGDIIKSINNKTINDIYEYMDRLSVIKPGMTVPMVIERNGEKINLNVTF